MNDKIRNTKDNISNKEALMILALKYGHKLGKNLQEIFEELWRETKGYQNTNNERYKLKSELKRLQERLEAER